MYDLKLKLIMNDSEMINEVEAKIVEIRGIPVIADADVAALYGVKTKEVNQAVYNNPDKFNLNYMFELNMNELHDLRSKILTTNVSLMTRNPTKVFTESGLYMLATILSGDRAREVTSLELNFIIGKLKHSVKRVRKDK